MAKKEKKVEKKSVTLFSTFSVKNTKLYIKKSGLLEAKNV